MVIKFFPVFDPNDCGISIQESKEWLTRINLQMTHWAREFVEVGQSGSKI